MQQAEQEHTPYENKPYHKTRVACAVTALMLICFLIGHAVAGSLYIRIHFEAALHWVAWLGPVVAIAHIVLCAVESVCMMTDKINPPSMRKKQHMAKKWVSGILLLVLLAVHIKTHAAWATLALMALILWHALVGTKSLVRDFRLPRRLINPTRVVIVVIVALLTALFLWGLSLF